MSVHENAMIDGTVAHQMQKVKEKFAGIEKKCVSLPARLQKPLS